MRGVLVRDQEWRGRGFFAICDISMNNIARLEGRIAAFVKEAEETKA
ncbi:hypothetical protein M527_23640 [Sphingobium indicum IP26]|nr:hypothetical protein M527_23640 [Sphingobium indicum IP26]